MAPNRSAPGIELPRKREDLDFIKETTLDQLITFLYVCKERSISGASNALNRDQTTTKGMIEKLERRFEKISREGIIIPSTQRGGSVLLTATGERLEKMADEVVSAAWQAVNDITSGARQPRIRIGLTVFMVETLSAVDSVARPMLAKAGFKVHRELYHVRSQDVADIVARGAVDLSLGGLTSSNVDNVHGPEGVELLIYDKQKFGLLSNYDTAGKGSKVEDLLTYQMPLILPSEGPLRGLVEDRFRKRFANLHIVEYSNDVYFSLDTLTFAEEPLCMIGTRSMERKLANRRRAMRDKPKDFFFQEFKNAAWGVTVGLFRRKSDKPIYGPDHPLSIYWNAFQQYAKQQKGRQ